MDSYNIFLNQSDSMVLFGKMILEEIKAIRQEYEAQMENLTMLFQRFVLLYRRYKRKHTEQDVSNVPGLHKTKYKKNLSDENLSSVDSLPSKMSCDVAIQCSFPLNELITHSSVLHQSNEDKCEASSENTQHTVMQMHSSLSSESDFSDYGKSNQQAQGFDNDNTTLTDIGCQKIPFVQLFPNVKNVEKKTFVTRKRSNKDFAWSATPRTKRSCPVCDKVFYSSVMRRHMRTHTREKPYKCDKCTKRFASSTKLNAHKIVHTGKKPFTCIVCDKAFSRKDVRDAHFQTHGEYKHKCKLCGKAFQKPWHVKRHLVSHTGEKPYQCKECNKSFAQQGGLKQHMQIHTGKNLYKCDRCEKSFLSNCDLIRHMRCHTKEKPYQCNVCKVSFSLNGTLKTHMKTHRASSGSKS